MGVTGKKEVAEGVAGVAVLILFYAWLIFWVSLAASYLWDWFIVPVFGMGELSIAATAGIYVFVRLMVSPDGFYDATRDGKKLTDKLGASIFYSPISCCAILFAGYIIKGFL